MRHKISIFQFTILLFSTFTAYANDSTARIGAGGLTFTKTDDIRMTNEKLTISTESIVVKYRFLNESNSPVSSVVAFPMPSFGWNAGQSALDANVGPIESFIVSVDGHKVATKTESKALLKEIDITNSLRKIGLSNEQIFRTFAFADMELEVSKKQLKQLKKLGAFGVAFPEWVVSETAYWKQIFPAKQEIRVEHSYKPMKGQVFTNVIPNTPLTQSELAVSSILDDSTDRSCLAEGALDAIAKKIDLLGKKGAKSVQVYLNDVEYILGTARNWKGPISDFTLDIVKENPDSIVSLCFPGKPVRVDDKTIRFHFNNFIPPDRVWVNFYTFFPYP